MLRFHVRRQLLVRDDAVDFRIQIARSHFAGYPPFHPSIHICLPLPLTHSLSHSCSCAKLLNSLFVRTLAIVQAPIFTPIILQFLFEQCVSRFILPTVYRAAIVRSHSFALHDAILNGRISTHFYLEKNKIETKQKIARLQVNHIPRTPSFVYSRPEEHTHTHTTRSSFQI